MVNLLCMANNEELMQQVAEVENQQGEVDSEKKKKSKAKYFLNISIVLIVTAIAIFFTVYKDFWEIVNNVLGADWRWLLGAFGIMAGTIMIRSIVLFCFARLYTRDYHLHQAMAVDNIGTFYNAVTPGASGGQVMMAYTYKKQGIAISSAVSMLAMYSIMYQIVLICFGLVSFIVEYKAIAQIGGFSFNIGSLDIYLPIWPLTIIGFILNVGVILVVLLMGYWKGFHNFVMGPIISLGAKLHLVKNPDKTRENLRIQVENFKVELRRMFSNIPFTILIFFLFTAYFILFFSIPYFVGQSLGNESTCANFWDSIFLSNYHQMITGIFPIPGSVGWSEIAFSKLFISSYGSISPETSFFFRSPDWEDITNAAKIIYAESGYASWEDSYNQAIIQVQYSGSEKLCRTALLLWRSITFIIPLVIAGFVTAFYHASPKKEAEESFASRATFVTLQNETYAERSLELETMLETAKLTRDSIMERLKNSTKPKPKKKKKVEVTVESQTKYDDINIEEEDDSI